MSSTDFAVDRRDIRFVQKEYLKVDDLCGLEPFGDFNPELFEMVVTEGLTFAEEVFFPLNKPGDEAGLKLENGLVVTPPGFQQAWKKMAEGGWMGMTAPTEYGGQGLPLSVAVAVQEALFGANPSLYITMLLTQGAAGLITAFGTDEQKKLFGERMIAGQWGGTMCLSESQAGSAVGEVLSRAVPAPEGHYLLTGAKQWISGGDHDFTENIIHLVLARIEGAPPGTKGLSLFVVPKHRVNGTGAIQAPNGVSTVRLEHKLGIKASPTCVLDFGGTAPCHAYLLGGAGQGMAQMFKLMNEARQQIGYQGLGAAAAALHNGLDYARERVQGPAIEGGRGSGQSAIIHHPDVRHMLATIRAIAEGLRGLMYKVAWMEDMAHHGPPDNREYYQNLADFLTPVVKVAGSDLGFEAARLAIQVLGGVGYTEEFPLAQNLRDIKIASIYEGTNGIQALDLVGRKLNLREGALLEALMHLISPMVPTRAMASPLRQAIVWWREALEGLSRTVEELRKATANHGPRQGVFNATGVTDYFTHVMLAHTLLDMALTAEEKLKGLFPEYPGDPHALAAFAAQNEEARFYFNKTKTAEHYVTQILPRVKAVEAAVASNSFAALEALW